MDRQLTLRGITAVGIDHRSRRAERRDHRSHHTITRPTRRQGEMNVGLGKVVSGQELYVNQHNQWASTRRPLWRVCKLLKLRIDGLSVVHSQVIQDK